VSRECTKDDVEVNVAAGGSGTGITASYGNGSYSTFADNKLEGRKLPMAVTADLLAQFADRPVVGMAGLTGRRTFSP
jgi:hypothetical protein